MYNCDVYGDVNFGRGVVEVRCTEVGEHKIHRCVVVIYNEEETVEASNVFDNSQNLHRL